MSAVICRAMWKSTAVKISAFEVLNESGEIILKGTRVNKEAKIVVVS